MGTTSSFLHIGNWPEAFCGMTDSAIGFNYIDNLNESDVMAFAWSTETMTITTAGTVSNGTSTANIANTLTFDPYGINATLYDEGGASGMWCPTTSLWIPWNSFPANKTPRDRACAPELVGGRVGNIFGVEGRVSGDPTNSFFGLFFYVCPDPINLGKFKLYFGLSFTVYASAGVSDYVGIYFNDNDFGGSFANGTVTLGGFVLPWYAYIYGTGTLAVGTTPSLTGSTSNYTYV